MVRELIKKDSRRYFQGSGILAFLKGMRHPGFRFMFLHRVCSHTNKFTPWGAFARFWFSIMQVRFGFQIPHIAKIGGGLFMGHFGNIVVNSKAVIGENCNLAQGVTIGQINVGEKKGCPVIGNRVWIGANAVIVGKITIGDDVLIAPLAFVNFDVPPGSLVIGNPARIISGKGNEGYINNIQ
jgi:serine O-acetyltransferase